MPDRETIERIAKILARAGSDNPNEATQALHGAYHRMVRDGVSLTDLLTLPISDLYQDTLVKLVDVILADQPNLSLSSRRAAYSEYMRLIVARFSGDFAGSSQSRAPGGGKGSGASQSREDEAREYEQRRRQQESERKEAAGATSQNPSHSDSNQFSRQNSFMAKWQNVIKTFKIGRLAFSFSPAAFFSGFQGVFGYGSITWHTFHNPGRALRLFAASFLYGLGFSAVLLFVVALIHAALHIRPIVDIRLKDLFAFFAVLGTLIKARRLYLDGWFSW